MTTHRLLPAALTALLSACAPAPESPRIADPGDSFAVVDVTVVPMDEEVLLERQTVVVEAGEIVDLGPSDGVEIPAAATLIDGRGLYLMPGLYDLHVHQSEDAELVMYLANGVTTVLNLHGDEEVIERRAAIEAGELLGPRLKSCAAPLRGSRLEGDEAVARIEAATRDGFDCVKIRGDWEPETYRRISDTATRLAIPLMGHAPRNLPFEVVLDEGTQQIVHLEEIVYTTAALDEWLERYEDDSAPTAADDPAATLAETVDDLARRLEDRGIWIVPTQIVIDNYQRRASETGMQALQARPYLRYLDPVVRRDWARATVFASRRRFEQQVRLQHYLLRVFRDRGVRLAAGTDAAAGDLLSVMPGWSLHEELAILIDVGFTPYEALRTATVSAAAFLGERGEGVIRRGARADLILLEGDPLRSIAAAASPLAIVHQGRWLARAEVERALDEIASEHEPLEAQLARLDAALEQESPRAWLAELDRIGEVEPALGSYVEREINRYGYRLLGDGSLDEAIDVFQLNVDHFSDSANTYDSLAEAWLEKGDRDRAIDLYRQALEVDPDFQNARRMLRELTGDD